jgi:hypothetical protein
VGVLATAATLTGGAPPGYTGSTAARTGTHPGSSVIETGIRHEPDENDEPDRKKMLMVPGSQVYCYRAPSTMEFKCVYTPYHSPWPRMISAV